MTAIDNRPAITIATHPGKTYGHCNICGRYRALNQDGTVRRHRTTADLWCPGSRQAPEPVIPADPRRAQWIADARALLDLLESNPALPVGDFRIAVYPDTGADDTDCVAVDSAAAVLGVKPVTTRYGGHYQATFTHGRATYEVTAIPATRIQRQAEVQRLGEAALAESVEVSQ